VLVSPRTYKGHKAGEKYDYVFDGVKIGGKVIGVGFKTFLVKDDTGELIIVKNKKQLNN
jgi:hypothetical protein